MSHSKIQKDLIERRNALEKKSININYDKNCAALSVKEVC